MATTTNILGLTKPSGEDPVDISVLNNNFQLIDNAFQNFVNVIYPVGSIYISTAPTNPATLFQIGTWERIGAGRTLIDCGTGYAANSTGGAATVTLTAAQSGIREHTHATTVTQPVFKLPNHHHQVNAGWQDNGAKVDRLEYGQKVKGSSPSASGGVDFVQDPVSLPNCTRTTNVAVSVTKVNNANATSAHNNMPPYLAVYMWKRVA